ncbi:MAG: MotA/TolQ/ExbB proton channel family protein [Zetaproteobacteria bacterium]|nr:MotA/TolQ/ExbB proton channel family protein [Zetaproteobacteria bacterium]
MWEELAISFQSGNIYIYLLLALSFIAMTFIVERIVMLQFVLNIDFTKFLNELRKMVTSEDYERAMNLCKRASRTSLPKIALRALEAAENDPSTVRGVIEEDTIDFLPRIETRLASLPVIATLMMLMGILGTMDGLWWAFHSIDILDTAKKQASLATGIAASLHPTTIALISSMFVLAFHQMLKSMAIRMLERTQHGVAVLHNLLVPEAAPMVVAAGVSSPQIGPTDTVGDIPPSIGEDSEVASAGDVAGEDTFDDAIVDDIKDEEEII